MTTPKLDMLLGLAPDALLVVDRTSRVAAANDRAAALFARERGELTGRRLDELLVDPPDARDGLVELVAVRADGARLPVEVAFGTATGADPLTSVSLRDLGERRGREAGLREAGERFQRLFEDGPIAMAMVGDDYRLAEVNDAFCRLTGYTAEELRELTFAEITHADDVATDLRLAREVFAGEVPGYSIDKRYVRKSREIVWGELTVSAIRDESGRVLKGLGLVQDITERRRALADVQTELQRLARDRDRVLQFANEGIYHVDERGGITFANPAAAEMLGWSVEELVGKPAHELLHHTRADGSHYARAECPMHGPTGVHTAVENPTDDVFWRRDGKGFPVDCRSAPVRATDASGVVVVFSDVSERHRMQAALRDAGERAARERVQAAEAERARWARELHDETLQGLAGLHVMLSSEIWGTSAELRERISEAEEQIENEMEKLRGLISELRPAALDELGLEASIKDLAERTQAVYGIEVETVVELHQPDGEPRRLASEVETAAYRIVQESLGNAARHAGASRVVVELAQRNASLGLRVRDDGRGFDPANETRGFGLRGMRERVALLNGRLEIVSKVGGGTEVAADMPLMQDQDRK